VVTTSTTVAATNSTVASTSPQAASNATTLPAVPAASAASLSAVAGKTILVDPGHNGQNYAHASVINRLVNIGTQWRACDTTGTATNDGYSEASYTLDVSLKLRAILESAGAHVVMTRTDNNGVGPCIDQRAKIGNDAHAAVGISIHADGGPATGRGFHVIFPKSILGLTEPIAASSKRLALDVRAAYAAGSGMPITTYLAGGGLSERSDLGGLNLSTIPKVFIETGNMRNATDAALLKSDAFRQRAAMAIANGLAAYLAGR
jgi:N-acetylmuramoyl-L-alanine amidase